MGVMVRWSINSNYGCVRMASREWFVISWRVPQVGVMGPFDVAGVIGLCDGVLLRLMRSVTSTSSPTRRTAPEGPAQAYWPNTGLSMQNCQKMRVEKIWKYWSGDGLTREFLIDSAIFRQKPVELAVRGDHATLGKVCIQAQAADSAE
jgi:hypothetical protein